MEPGATMAAMNPLPIVGTQYAAGGPHGRIVGKCYPDGALRHAIVAFGLRNVVTLVPTFVLFILFSDRFAPEYGHLARNSESSVFA